MKGQSRGVPSVFGCDTRRQPRLCGTHALVFSLQPVMIEVLDCMLEVCGGLKSSEKSANLLDCGKYGSAAKGNRGSKLYSVSFSQ